VTAALRVRLHVRIAEALERRYGEAAEQLRSWSHYAEAAVLGREYAVKGRISRGWPGIRHRPRSGGEKRLRTTSDTYRWVTKLAMGAPQCL
jgi:hypothetical protein